MDIKSGCGYPASALSNFAPHGFEIDGITCASMEGFLQSLKFSSIYMQVEVCKLVGIAAKRRGKGKPWHRTQTLYWRGKEINRHSEEYQALLDRAYNELAKNDSFRRALVATGTATIEHSIGRRDPSETVLTRREFCSRLHRLRNEINAGERYEQ